MRKSQVWKSKNDISKGLAKKYQDKSQRPADRLKFIKMGRW